MKTAKILEITGTKQREGQNGTVHYISVVMENGDKGTIGKKSADALKIGDELTYTIESKEHNGNTYYTIKEIKDNNFQKKSYSGYSRNYKADFISFAMSYAKDLAVAGKIDAKDEILWDKADSIYTWMIKQYNDLDKTPEKKEEKKQTMDSDIPF
jgi:hypothetical protein